MTDAELVEELLLVLSERGVEPNNIKLFYRGVDISEMTVTEIESLILTGDSTGDLG